MSCYQSPLLSSLFLPPFSPSVSQRWRRRISLIESTPAFVGLYSVVILSEMYFWSYPSFLQKHYLSHRSKQEEGFVSIECFLLQTASPEGFVPSVFVHEHGEEMKKGVGR